MFELSGLGKTILKNSLKNFADSAFFLLSWVRSFSILFGYNIIYIKPKQTCFILIFFTSKAKFNNNFWKN